MMKFFNVVLLCGINVNVKIIVSKTTGSYFEYLQIKLSVFHAIKIKLTDRNNSKRVGNRGFLFHLPCEIYSLFFTSMVILALE